MKDEEYLTLNAAKIRELKTATTESYNISREEVLYILKMIHSIVTDFYATDRHYIYCGDLHKETVIVLMKKGFKIIEEQTNSEHMYKIRW